MINLQKPIIQTVTNNMGVIIVIRSPFARQWLFNLCLSYGFIRALEWLKLAPLAMALTFALVACDDSLVPQNEDYSLVNTRYIHEAYKGPTCWYPQTLDPQKDSLIIDQKRYAVSSRSRYRVATLPASMLDVIAEGPVTETNWGIYKDTKTDTIYILNECEGK